MVLQPSDHVVIVGAGFGGWRSVEALRRDGYDGAITLIGEETYAPYDRPPLSKHVLALKWDVERATLATPERVEESRRAPGARRARDRHSTSSRTSSNWMTARAYEALTSSSRPARVLVDFPSARTPRSSRCATAMTNDACDTNSNRLEAGEHDRRHRRRFHRCRSGDAVEESRLRPDRLGGGAATAHRRHSDPRSPRGSSVSRPTSTSNCATTNTSLTSSTTRTVSSCTSTMAATLRAESGHRRRGRAAEHRVARGVGTHARQRRGRRREPVGARDTSPPSATSRASVGPTSWARSWCESNTGRWRTSTRSPWRTTG